MHLPVVWIYRYDLFTVYYALLSAIGALVAQWVKPWPTDLAVQVPSLLERNLLNRKGGSIAHSILLSSAHRPDMTGILLKRT